MTVGEGENTEIRMMLYYLAGGSCTVGLGINTGIIALSCWDALQNEQHSTYILFILTQ